MPHILFTFYTFYTFMSQMCFIEVTLTLKNPLPLLPTRLHTRILQIRTQR